MKSVLVLVIAGCTGAKVQEVEPPAPEPAAAAGTLGADVTAVLDMNVDPCTDFYAFACGGWIANTPLPPDKPRLVRSFTTIEDENELMLRAVLDDAVAAPGDDPVKQKLGTFYGACMDQAGIDAAGTAPLDGYLKLIDGVKRKDALMGVVGHLQRAGVDALFGVWVDADAKNPDLAILQLVQGGTALPDRDLYLAEDANKRDAYKQHVQTMFTLLGRGEAEAKKAAEEVLAFETSLAEFQWTPEAMRDSDKTYNKLDKAGVEKLTPGLDWTSFLGAQGYPALTQINVMTPSYFEGMAKLVEKTDLNVLKTYLTWHLLTSTATELPKPFDDENFAFFGKILSGQEMQRERWKRCVEMTDTSLGDLLAQAYISQAFSGDSKPIAVDMIGRIETAFEAGLEGLAWMDPETRARAVEKARAITNKIGYPDTFRTYDFPVQAGDFYGNRRRADAAESSFWLDKAEKPVDPEVWYMTAQTVNAYYNPPANEIVFPAGILQAPFFDKDFPKAMNFGAIGMVMGHEITHGFDDEGRKFDADGRLTDWWAPDAVQRFEDAASCVEDQYSAYEVAPGLKVSGKLTLGENIADLGGLRVAFRAYNKWVEENGPEPRVAGLTGNQQFFVSHAQAWCTVATPEWVERRVKTDPHAPSQFRVNGPLVNLPEFAEAFSCEVGKPMRPEAICEVW